LLGNKWTMLVMGALGGGPLRFGELRRQLGGITQKMLTQTLRNLEAPEPVGGH
jgi:DNA-binding HxlR family transcriptional regulator